MNEAALTDQSDIVLVEWNSLFSTSFWNSTGATSFIPGGDSVNEAVR